VHGPNGGVADTLDEAQGGGAAPLDGAPGRGRSASAFFRKSRREMLNLSISTDVKLFGRRPQQGLATRTGAGVRKAAADETARCLGRGVPHAPLWGFAHRQRFPGGPDCRRDVTGDPKNGHEVLFLGPSGYAEQW